MSGKIVLGPLDSGLQNDTTAFNIAENSFYQLINAQQFRKRVRRKRGTSLLTHLNRLFSSNSVFALSGSSGSTGTLNLISSYGLSTISPNSSIVAGTVTMTIDGTSYSDTTTADGTLIPAGTIHYGTGLITIPTKGGTNITALTLNYYPNLPVMGLESFNTQAQPFPNTVAFDTTYSYEISTLFPFYSYDVSYYKNPATSGTYTQKTTWTRLIWNLEDYMQVWSCNYQGALWTTPGVQVPFVTTNLGMQFKPITTVTVTSATTATLTITNHGLVIGDYVFINEVATTTGINFQTGYVTTVTDANNVVVTFPNASIATSGSGGIAQYLTSTADSTKDCIRWYDGDPTTGYNTATSTTKGWVNFCPPLSYLPFSVGGKPPQTYYLVSAKMIVPFKDRLLFFAPVIQTSQAGSVVFLPDVVIYSQVGTSYYTCSFTGDPRSAITIFTPLLVPTDQVAQALSFAEDISGRGGFVSAGIEEIIETANSVEDVILLDMETQKLRLIYTGNDLLPFQFYIIDAEMGGKNPFAAVNLGKGTSTVGSRGITFTDQVQSRRVDTIIPDEIFEFNSLDNGQERVCAQRDFISEWIYYSYKNNQASNVFNNKTLMYNYRENTWGTALETYTTYGSFQKRTGITWATVGTQFKTWSEWNTSWKSGKSTLLKPQVISGNPQGYVVIRDEGTTGESPSMYISSISQTGSVITVTSANHCLEDGDYVQIVNATGTFGTSANSVIYKINRVNNNQVILLGNAFPSAVTYLGKGEMVKVYVPFIQTRQMSPAWSDSKKTRLGVQQYLLSSTPNGKCTLLIYLNQNSATTANNTVIIPDLNSGNNSLVYSTEIYTSPEPNNLNQLAASSSSQIWHRMNTSLIGDTVQIALTFNDEQIRSLDNAFTELELHYAIFNVSPAGFLS